MGGTLSCPETPSPAPAMPPAPLPAPLCPKSSKSKAYKGPPLVPSPGNPPEGYTAAGFLQNCDYGEIDRKKYNIDLSVQVLNLATIEAFVKARKRWTKVITGDVPDSNVTEALLAVNLSATDILVNACGNQLPRVIDDVHICAVEGEIDGAGATLFGSFVHNIVAFVLPGIVQSDTEKDSYRTLVTGNIVFDSCDAARLIKMGIWEDFVLKAMGTVIGTSILGPANLANETTGEYIGKHGNEVWNDWGCSGKPPVKFSIFPAFENKTGPGFDYSRIKGVSVPSWDSSCLVNELMGSGTLESCERWTGFCSPTSGSKLSKLSVASFQDLGYKVNYAAADKYDGRNTTCCFTGNDSVSLESIQPALSESAKEYATDIGRKLWKERKDSMPEVRSLRKDDGGDARNVVINVLIEENGHLYNLAVPLSELE